jgi:hypothetical protein
MKLSFPFEMPPAVSIGNSRWRTTSDWVFEVGPLTLSIPPGFVTDLYSSPWAARLFIPCDEPDNRPALIHDYLYGTAGARRTADCQPFFCRKECDEVLLEAMCKCGFSRTRRTLIYRAVRAGGWVPWGKLVASKASIELPAMS